MTTTSQSSQLVTTVSQIELVSVFPFNRVRQTVKDCYCTEPYAWLSRSAPREGSGRISQLNKSQPYVTTHKRMNT